MTPSDCPALAADIAPGTGGRKARLVARCWVATRYGAECGLSASDYERFRSEWTRQTFDAIHRAFDHLLPPQFRAKVPGTATGTPRQAKQRNGLTEAQQKQFDRFCKAPARLEKQFNKSADYFLSCGNTDHLQATAKRYREAADYCRSLIGDVQTLAGLWNLGMRTGGDLESQVERTLRI